MLLIVSKRFSIQTIPRLITSLNLQNYGTNTKVTDCIHFGPNDVTSPLLKSRNLVNLERRNIVSYNPIIKDTTNCWNSYPSFSIFTKEWDVVKFFHSSNKTNGEKSNVEIDEHELLKIVYLNDEFQDHIMNFEPNENSRVDQVVKYLIEQNIKTHALSIKLSWREVVNNRKKYVVKCCAFFHM